VLKCVAASAMCCGVLQYVIPRQHPHDPMNHCSQTCDMTHVNAQTCDMTHVNAQTGDMTHVNEITHINDMIHMNQMADPITIVPTSAYRCVR